MSEFDELLKKIALATFFDKLRNIYESRNMETEVTYRNAIRFLKMRLLKPEVDIVKQFDMAFITNAIFEMNDILAAEREFK